jgi:MFS family permease
VQQQAGFAQVMRHREVRALALSAVLSGLGDQIARVALSVAVLHRSGSVLLTSCVYAVSYLPWVLGGPVLSTLADRLPVRRVLVGSDLFRAATVALMLVPQLPIWSLLLLLFLTELAAPPFEAGRSSLLPELLEGDLYVAGAALMGALRQACLFAGVALGGVLLTVVGPSTALAIDVATFLVSGWVLQRGLKARPATGSGPLAWRADSVEGLRAVFGQPGLRRLVLGAWIACAVAVLPEGLAIAYATTLNAPSYAVALLLAAEPAGAALAGLAVARLVPAERRNRLMWPLLIGGSVPLLGMLAAPGMGLAAVLLFLSGASSAGLLLVSTTVGRTVDPAVRARVFGIAASGLMVAQGIALLAGGALAELLPLHQVMALAGVVGVVAVLPLALADRRHVIVLPPDAPRTIVLPDVRESARV